MSEQPAASVQALLAQAIANDVDGLVTSAVDGYEKVLATGEAPVEAYINLACLYWRMRDFGFCSYHRDISNALYKHAWDQCVKVLDEAERHFPQCPETLFWRRYFAWADFDEPFPDSECLYIAELPGATLIPYFRLYMPPDAQFEAEARELWSICELQLTAKNQYIAPILRKKFAASLKSQPTIGEHPSLPTPRGLSGGHREPKAPAEGNGSVGLLPTRTRSVEEER